MVDQVLKFEMRDLKFKIRDSSFKNNYSVQDPKLKTRNSKQLRIAKNYYPLTPSADYSARLGLAASRHALRNEKLLVQGGAGLRLSHVH